MRIPSTFFFLLGVATLTLASFPTVSHSRKTSTPTRRTLNFNPTAEQLNNAPTFVTARAPQPLTNAKRLAMGLPPLNPRRRGAVAPRQSPLPPASTKCNILATETDGTFAGYVSPAWNSFGEYGALQDAQDGALEVSFSYSPDSPGQLSFTATNGPDATYPFIGAIKGISSSSSDLGPGSANYAYLGGTSQTPAGSPPSAGDNAFDAATHLTEDIESAIWSYDSSTQAITAQWINTDSSAPSTHIVHTQGVLALTGDVNAFTSTFGPTDEVIFFCVPPLPVVERKRMFRSA
ncbi:hypothetical protein C8R44DRAFT_893200 [Mycena epipterygia]|nr:hypothetical protein C8R44DRAFT_893200 [Mycena epipterygia]